MMFTSSTGTTSSPPGTARYFARGRLAIMEALRIQGLTRTYGRQAPAVNAVDLSVEPGTLFCLLGPSGCGKTTLLRLIGGYLPPDRGQILLSGRDITSQPLEQRN